MNTLFASQIKTPAWWCFDGQIRSLMEKCVEDSKTFGNIRQLYSKTPEFGLVTEIITLQKITISFFWVCWVSVCIFYSVERTSVTLPLKWQEIDSVLVGNSRLLLVLQEWGLGMNSIGET